MLWIEFFVLFTIAARALAKSLDIDTILLFIAATVCFLQIPQVVATTDLQSLWGYFTANIMWIVAIIR